MLLYSSLVPFTRTARAVGRQPVWQTRPGSPDFRRELYTRRGAFGRQVLEETVEGVRRGFCELLSQPKLPAPLLAAASDLRKQISGVYRTMREGVQRHATGRVYPGEGSLQEAHAALLDRIRARIVADGGLTEKQWQFVLANRGDVPVLPAAPAAEPAPASSPSQRASSRAKVS